MMAGDDLRVPYPRSWHWDELGQPTGLVGTDNPKIAYMPSATRPYVFYLSDMRLCCTFWNGDQWVPADQGTPPGVALTGGVGAVTVALTPGSGPQPFAVVQGEDANLWVNWWNNVARRWTWTTLGRPGTTALGPKVGVIAVADPASGRERLNVYMLGGDGNLWACVSDTARTTWTSLGEPPSLIRKTA
jgi:hypothetical protein